MINGSRVDQNESKLIQTFKQWKSHSLDMTNYWVHSANDCRGEKYVNYSFFMSFWNQPFASTGKGKYDHSALGVFQNLLTFRNTTLRFFGLDSKKKKKNEPTPITLEIAMLCGTFFVARERCGGNMKGWFPFDEKFLCLCETVWWFMVIHGPPSHPQSWS